MDEREALLGRLKDAYMAIKNLSEIQQKLNLIRHQYQIKRPVPKMGTVEKVFMVLVWLYGGLTILTAFIQLFQNSEYVPFITRLVGVLVGSVFHIAIVVGLTFVILAVNKSKNKKIVESNMRVEQFNIQLQSQEQAVIEELRQVQMVYGQKVASWYPEKYVSLDAVEFFYNAIKNYRADNLKEAINIYETTLHQRRMEANQQEQIRQQKLNNLLAVGSLVVQGAQVGAINAQTNAINFNTQAIRDATRY